MTIRERSVLAIVQKLKPPAAAINDVCCHLTMLQVCTRTLIAVGLLRAIAGRCHHLVRHSSSVCETEAVSVGESQVNV